MNMMNILSYYKDIYVYIELNCRDWFQLEYNSTRFGYARAQTLSNAPFYSF